MLHHDVDYTLFEGRRVTNWPRYTVLRGNVVWDRDGEGIIGGKGYSRFVVREASTLNDIWQHVEEAGPFDEELL
jgi:dihydropyrimidinase